MTVTVHSQFVLWCKAANPQSFSWFVFHGRMLKASSSFYYLFYRNQLYHQTTKPPTHHPPPGLPVTCKPGGGSCFYGENRENRGVS